MKVWLMVVVGVLVVGLVLLVAWSADQQKAIDRLEHAARANKQIADFTAEQFNRSDEGIRLRLTQHLRALHSVRAGFNGWVFYCDQTNPNKHCLVGGDESDDAIATFYRAACVSLNPLLCYGDMSICKAQRVLREAEYGPQPECHWVPH